MTHNINSVRNKLIEITGQGLLLKAIALNVNIDMNTLSRFKNGRDCLKKEDVEKLSEYLNAIVIPQWKVITREPEAKMQDSNKPKGLSALEKLKAKRISK